MNEVLSPPLIKGLLLSEKSEPSQSSAKTSRVIDENASRLQAIVNSLVRDTFETQDLVQDVFLEFVEANEADSVIENVGAWLVTVAKNKVFDRFRKNKSRDQYTTQVIQNSLAPQAQSGQDPESASWNTELREILREALMQLPEEQREVFIQHELDGKSFEDISKSSGVGVNTLLSRKRYAVQFLQEYLKEVYDELD